MTFPLEIARFGVGSDVRYRFSNADNPSQSWYSFTAPLRHSYIPFMRVSMEMFDAVVEHFPSTKLIDRSGFASGYAIYMSFEDRVALELRAVRY